MRSSADLPDLNVWLALAWPAHSHHQHAIHYWEQQAADQVLFCTVTALGLIRLVCQLKLMGTAVRNAAEASALLKALCQAAWRAAGRAGAQRLGGVSPAAAWC